MFFSKYFNEILVSLYCYTLFLGRKIWKSTLFFVFFLLTFQPVLAQIEHITKTDDYIITKRLLSVEDGMATREVLCAVEDKNGFMWFGTNNGLCRYDGNSFKIFTKQNFGLLSNEIYFLSIDANNNLIIQFLKHDLTVSFAATLQVLDLNNYTIHNLESIYPAMPFKSKEVIWVTTNGHKNLLFITAFPFRVWNYTESNGFKIRAELTEWNACKNREEINSSALDDRSIVENGGIVLKLNGYPNYLITQNAIVPFSDEKDATVVAITKEQSLLYYNQSSNDFFKSNLSVTKNNIKKDRSVSFLDFVPKISTYWYIPQSISDDATIIFNPKKQVYLLDGKEAILLIKPEELSDAINFGIYRVFRDSKGNRWLCTTNGVVQITIKPNFFKSYFSKKQETRPEFNQVRGIYASSDYDKNSKRVTKFVYANVWQYLCVSNSNSNKTAVSSDINGSAFNAFLKHKDKFYIGGINTIFEYQPIQNKTTAITTLSRGLFGNYIWSLAAASDSILLAGHMKGMDSYNIITKKNCALRYASSTIPKALNVYRFVKTKTKGLVAVAENGLYLIDKNNVIVSYYGSLVGDKIHHLPINCIYDMHEDKNGICWIASNGEGLFRWDWKNADTDKTIRIKQFTVNNGLPSMVLYRIEEDGANNLWVSTYFGLTRFNTITFSTAVYSTRDGLTNNEFNRTSSFKDADGSLYFGGIDGIIGFNPSELLKSNFKAEPSLQMIALNKFSGKKNKLVDYLMKYKQSNKILLAAGDSFLSLEFQLLDFLNKKHLYAYKIDGIDADWNYINVNTIRLSGLPYGEFKIHIKAQMDNGQWNSHPIVFPIVVLKPFYLKSWFLLFLIFIIIVCLVIFFRYRTNKLHRENHQLELKVADRTVALKKSLEDRELLLAEIHHRVKNNLQVISGLLELQKEQLEDATAKKAFSEGQSRVGSIALIHQNLYQNETLGNVEFCSFAKDLSCKVAELFGTQNNKVTFAIDEKEVYLDIDTAVPLGLILNELVTNSYKYFLQESQEHTITIAINSSSKGVYELIYRDNGPGLKESIDVYTATSLGLKLIRGLAKQLHGTVTYRFENGSVFVIQFKNLEVRNE